RVAYRIVAHVSHVDAPRRVRQHLQAVKLLARGIDFDFEDTRLGPSSLLALFNLFRKIFLVHIGYPFGLFGGPAKSKRAPYIASGCKAKSEICSGKNVIGRRSATSGIALQRKVEGHQRCEARINAAFIEPSSDFSGCCSHAP